MEDFEMKSPALEDMDEFERMLEEFIMSEFDTECESLTGESHKTGDTKPDEPDDKQEEPDEHDDEQEEPNEGSTEEEVPTEAEAEEEEPAEEEEDWLDEVALPSGLIEQNGSINVKVEILRPIAHPRKELDRLVGCRDIKARLDELVALTQYNKMMRERFPDSKTHEVSLHSIFFGRPGTGKTTVCKIFGSLLREAGVLSKGHVVVCNRGTFIGTLWGDEERSMRQAVQMAEGGVLMIDEAYLLNGSNQNDPGRLAVQLLMEILANEQQRDLAVVLCGYKQPMLRLLELNPGLQSRFPNRFEFQDFSVEELLQITRRRIAEYKYHFTRQAWEKYKATLAEAFALRDPDSWGNARFVANQLERIYMQHATRIVRQQPTDKRQLRSLTTADIPSMEVPRQKPRIGF